MKGGDSSFPDLSVPSVLFLSYSINRLTGTDGFRVLCHQFAPSSLPRRAHCLKRGSGSFEKDSPVEMVAMEKEQKTHLVHEL